MTKYIQHIIDIIYSRGCVKRSEIIKEVASRLGVSVNKTIDSTISQDLADLVRKGIVVRKARGIYCKPS